MSYALAAANRRSRRRQALKGMVPAWLKHLLKGAPDTSGRPAGPPPVPSLPFALPDSPTAPGYNWIGFCSSENGIGQSQRTLIQAALDAGEDVASLDISHLCPAKRGDRRWAHLPEEPVPGRRTVHHFKPTEVPVILDALGPDIFRVGWPIAYWLWELPKLPEGWGAFGPLYREIWTCSRFVADAIAAEVETPVRVMPLPVDIPPVPDAAAVQRARRDLGLPESGYLFGYIFDITSSLERKNPQALIRAFRDHVRADDDARLVVKTHGTERLADLPEGRTLLEGLDDERIVVIDEVWPRAKVDAFLDAIDCLVSLHRAEGFGLTLAEAMAREKAVIATNWSGNVDFLNDTNGFPVRCKVITLERDYGPYLAGNTWADPDSDHAGELMRRCLADSGGHRELRAKARQDIVAGFSPGAVGRLLAT